MMKRFILSLFALMLVWASPAKAAPDCAATPNLCRCIAVVFYDETQPAVDDQDLSVEIVAWPDVGRLNRFNRLPIASTMVFYDQFGLQGGPTLTSGQEEYAFTFIPAANGDERGLTCAAYNSAGGGSGEDASRTHWTGAPDDFSDVGKLDDTAPTGLERAFMAGADAGGFIGVTDSAIVARADALAGNIRDNDIKVNGCP